MNVNVEMITQFFTEHLEQLKDYGDNLDNPMDILLKGLLAVPCEEFHRYIINKEDMNYDGSLTLTPGEFVIIRASSQSWPCGPLGQSLGTGGVGTDSLGTTYLP